MNHPLFAVAGQNYYLKPRNFLAQPQLLHYSLLLSRTPTGLAKSELSKKPFVAPSGSNTIVPSGSSFHVVPCGKNAPISSLSAR